MENWQKKLSQLHQWWQTPGGKYLIEVERRYLGHIIQQLFGYQFVIIADDNYASLSNVSRMSQVLRLDPMSNVAQALPDNIDAILIPHYMTYFPELVPLLQSIQSNLDTNGKLIYTAYNFFSYLGLQKLLHSKAVQGLPKKIHSIAKINSELVDNHYVINTVSCLAPFWIAKKTKPVQSYLAESYWGNIKCIIASKKLATVKSFKTEWQDKSVKAQPAINSRVEGEQNAR